MTLESAAGYHRQTKYNREGMSGAGMDWSNKPQLYKVYPDAETVSLPRDLALPRAESWRVLKGGLAREPQPLDLAALSNLLFMAYGFTAQVDYGNELFLYRSAPSAGALYPVEIYLACRGVDGLEDGLYNYSLIDFALTRLRQGPPPESIPAPALIITGLFFRSAWKYNKRAFRYCLLDVGHVAENVDMIGPVLGLPADFRTDFNDEYLSAYLGLDREKEAVLAVMPLGEDWEGKDLTADEEAGLSAEGMPQAEPTAGREEIFDLIVQAARLTSAARENSEIQELPQASGDQVSLPDPDWSDLSGPSLVQTLQQRRSRRNFKPRTVHQAEVARVLTSIVTPDVGRFINLGVLTNEVEDLPDGFYFCRPGASGLIRHKSGFLGPDLSKAALGQDWVGRANLILVITSPLARLEEKYGPRALRLAYLAAGRLGQRAYLAAETAGWGCCGVGAFFDDEVSSHLDIPPGEDPLYILPLGPIKKRTHGGRPTQQ